MSTNEQTEHFTDADTLRREIDALTDQLEAAEAELHKLNEAQDAAEEALIAAEEAIQDASSACVYAEQGVGAAHNALVAKIAEAHRIVPNFKAFCETLKIGRSRAYELLKEAEGQGDEVKTATRERVTRHRRKQAETVSVTRDDVTDTPVVKHIIRQAARFYKHTLAQADDATFDYVMVMFKEERAAKLATTDSR